jgi:ABC-type bacteriocin/lantibiotic exporter with double-glycine peptidase domain
VVIKTKDNFRKSTSGCFSLSDISLSVNQGDLIGVVGKVGSGKSSLLDAFLGELDKVSGQIFVRDPYAGIGLVMQEHWLQKGTVRDNVRNQYCPLVLTCT